MSEYVSTREVRVAFRKKIQQALERAGFVFSSATLGREPQEHGPRQTFWRIVTSEAQAGSIDQFHTTRVNIPHGTDPYSHEALDLVLAAFDG